MRESLSAIEQLLQKREVKKAEILIARQLRNTLPSEYQARLLILRARARLLTARPEAAIDDLDRAGTYMPPLLAEVGGLELLADAYFARFELSSVGFAERNDAQLAEQLYRRIISEFPGYENLGWVYYQLGRVLLTSLRTEAALDCFQQALLLPGRTRALTSYCYERLGFVAFYEQRDPNRSMMFLTKAIDTYPASEDHLWLVQVYILRSKVLREMNQPDQALIEAEKALALASTGRQERRTALAEALLTTGELLATQDGREKELITCLEQFLQVSKRPPGVDVTWSRVYEMLGDAYFRVGRNDDALIAYHAVMQFNPYHPWEVTVYHRMARVYYQSGSFEKAAEVANRALSIADSDGQTVDYRLYDIFGNACFALGRYDRAVEAYSHVLRLAPPGLDSLDRVRQYHQIALEKIEQLKQTL